LASSNPGQIALSSLRFKIILLLPYYSVDHMVIIGNNEEAIKDLKRFLSICFKIKDLGLLDPRLVLLLISKSML
jgi:hypothetical protein